MNYRHAFHAGNFADVFKHLVLTLLIEHLKRKPTPFRVIDTHAGAGLYDLSGEEAGRTDEWRGGVGRLDGAELPEAAALLIGPYRGVVDSVRREQGETMYPGSPEVARRLLRAADRLVAIEKHPETADALRLALGWDRRVRVMGLDGWVGLRANIPPKERRGVVLIDPPFEAADEFDTLARALGQAWRKWPGGLYAAWYPARDGALTEAFARAVEAAGVERVLRAELIVDASGYGSGLPACGMLVVNPPWTLKGDLEVLLPALAQILAVGEHAGWRCDWAVPERDSDRHERAG